MKNGLWSRIAALLLAVSILFTVAGCYRVPKQKVVYVTSEYEVEVEDEATEDAASTQEDGEDESDTSGGSDVKKPHSSKDKTSSANKGTSSSGTTISGGGNSFLGSGGINVSGSKVTVENVSNALYTANPTIKWSELSEGQTVNIQIKDSAGTVVFKKSGLTGTSHKCEAGLTNGAYYNLKVTYANADGTENEVNSFGGDGKKVLCLAKTSAPVTGGDDYSFNGSISLEVLNNYLDRTAYYGVMSSGLDPVEFDEAARYLLNVGAKYVLRAGGEWYASNGPTNFAAKAKEKIAQIHEVDPDIIFEACIFETVTSSIEKVKIPAWVFEDFGLTPEDRNFKMANTIFKDGYGINQMGLNAHIPDITTIEHQMFVYYRATQYIDMGFEAFHLGQVNLIGKNDPNDEAWTKVIGMIREYAKEHARRGYVIINSHGELINSKNGAQLVDMIVSPSWIRSSADEVDHEVSDDNPQRCDIYPSMAAAPYNKRVKGTSPSGWTTDSYPYLVHLDNYDDGVNGDHSKKDHVSVWGWDETSWYINQPQWSRVIFMKKIFDKIAKYDENGHFALIMKGSGGKSLKGEVYAVNNKSEYCPEGSGDEEFTKYIFSGDDEGLKKYYESVTGRNYDKDMERY